MDWYGAQGTEKLKVHLIEGRDKRGDGDGLEGGRKNEIKGGGNKEEKEKEEEDKGERKRIKRKEELERKE